MPTKRGGIPIKITNLSLLHRIIKLINEQKRCKDPDFEPKTPKHKHRPFDRIDIKKIDHTIKVDDDLLLIVEVDFSDYSKFKFRLNSNKFEFPFFRFDSHGHLHVHRNRNLPLGQNDSIECPHFHSFRKNGYAFAFRTDIIEKQAKSLEIPEFALNHYFVEANIDANGAIPKINIPPKLLPTSSQNPVSGITFP